MTRLSRRGLLVGGVAVAGLGAAAVVGGPAVAAPATVVARYLRASLPGLRIEAAELETFATAWLDRISWRGAKRAGVLAIMDNPSLAGLLPARFGAAHDWFTRRLVTDFLFSTDFFGEAMRDPAATRMAAYADPYALGCRNPLANLEPPLSSPA